MGWINYARQSIALAALGGLLGACTLEDVPKPIMGFQTTPLELSFPVDFPAPILMESNPLTEEGVLLGKILFFDPSISANGKVSCASCHIPRLAFSDGVALPENGVSGNPLERHSPALFNLAWMGNGLFWDGGSKNLESQAFGPLTHADEMGMDMSELEHRLRMDEKYPELFEEAFEDGITSPNVVKALAQFERTLVSAGSQYDKSKQAKSGIVLNELELKGLSLVQNHCVVCHKGELFTDNLFQNNGLDSEFAEGGHELILLGRFRISHQEKDMGAFKTPSLRNVMLSAPYMHDGRFSTIEAVLDHYSDGVKDVPTTSDLLYQREGKVGIPLSQSDKAAIKAFLHTLTDHDFVSDKSWPVTN